jgi:hypothetical protein
MQTVFRIPLKKIVHILDGTPAEYGRGKQRGQSLVELAFVTPILIIMIAGIVEIGWYANNYIALLEAAKVGARRGPFLSGENTPQRYEEKFLADNNGDDTPDSSSVIHPLIASANATVLNAPTSAVDPVLENTRYSTRGYTYPMSQTSCDNIPIDEFGFYNLIVCTVLDSLDPLEIRVQTNDPKHPPGAPEVYQDDIVISVFSMKKVNNGPVGSNNPDGSDDDGDGTAEGTPYDIDLNALSSIDYPAGHQVVLAGRWPSDANECYDGTTNLETRDPFDYIVDGVVNYGTVISDGKTVFLPYEIANPVYNDAGEVIGYDGYADVWQERQRGWVYTGQRPINVGPGFTGLCWGSDFSLEDIEVLLNLPNFVQVADGNYQNRRRYLPSQGIVLVEVFWEHELLMGDAFPLFYSAYGLFTNIGGDAAYEQDGNVIHVWAAFPAPSAEPTGIVYRLD